MSTPQMTTPFVIRKTFLELPDEATPFVESRCRSVSDYTDARRIRSWSNCSGHSGYAPHLLKSLDAVMESESDTDVPDELDEIEMDGESPGETSGSSTLSAEMFELLEAADDTCRERARTSSTLFWFDHEAAALLPLADEAEASSSPSEPELAEEPLACTHSDGVQGHTRQNAAADFATAQEVYLQSLMPAYIGSILPPFCPMPMPWYACQPVPSVSSSVQQLRKPDSSSSLGVPKSASEQSLEALSTDMTEEMRSKLSKRKQRRGAHHSVWQSASGTTDARSEPTTVMLRNLPNRYTRKMFLRLLDLHGFSRDYDFVYLPIDFKHKVNLGYAFVNMASHESAVRLKDCLDGFKGWAFDSQKVCEAVWASPHQGLAPNIERYRNSPVMHESVSDEFRPLLFKDGVRVAFPPPTKSIRAPKARETGTHA